MTPTDKTRAEFERWFFSSKYSQVVIPSKGDTQRAWDAWQAATAEAEADRAALLALLKRYRNETPLGHQPHMIAHVVDEAIARVEKQT